MRRDKTRERRIARERIGILMERAEDEAKKGNAERTERYVALAKRIGTRYNVRFPRNLKRMLCKHCDSFLLPSVNCRVRLNNRTVTIYCCKCERFTRIPHLKEKKEKKERKVKETKKEKNDWKEMAEKGKAAATR